jgi:hypothetical protein
MERLKEQGAIEDWATRQIREDILTSLEECGGM